VILNGDFEVHDVVLEDGTARDLAIDVRERLMLPFTSAVIDKRLVLSSSLGMVVINDAGELVGADAMDGQGRLEPAMFTTNAGVVVETGERETMDVSAGDAVTSRLVLLSARDARVLHDQPVMLYTSPTSLVALDGKVLVGQGPFTIVYSTK
jgi:hypothetical protein